MLATFAMLGATACASAGANAGIEAANRRSASRQSHVALSITNKNFNDVNVYALVEGTREQLAMVRSMSTRRLLMPTNTRANGNVQLLVDPVGGVRSFTTDPILVNPGDTIRLTVAQELRMSEWTVR